MRKWLVGALCLLGSLGVFAQAHTGYFDILPGYQFNTGDYNVQEGIYRTENSGKDSWMGSLDVGWFFTDHVGLHGGYLYSPGDYHARLYRGPILMEDYTFSRSTHLLEIGPEFIWGPKDNQLYFQLNAGHTFGSGDTKFYSGGHKYDLGNIGSNEWVYGAALGYRHYFNESVGIAMQAAYHHIQNWEINDVWDARIGVVFRFPKPAPPPPAPPAPEPPPPPPPPPPAPAQEELPPPPPPAPTFETITLDESVLHFATDKWAIPEAADPALDDAVQKINQYPQFKIEIVGHTDSTGSDAWNAILSKRRAESVAKYLTAHGVDESRIVSVTGVGPSQPIADNKTSEGRSKNRRVEISAEPIRVRTN